MYTWIATPHKVFFNSFFYFFLFFVLIRKKKFLVGSVLYGMARNLCIYSVMLCMSKWMFPCFCAYVCRCVYVYILWIISESYYQHIIQQCL